MCPPLDVTIVVKGLLGRAGCTRMVQGGYNAFLTEPDSLGADLADTLQGGSWINDQELVCPPAGTAPVRPGPGAGRRDLRGRLELELALVLDRTSGGLADE